jgi:hypothetical protein
MAKVRRNLRFQRPSSMSSEKDRKVGLARSLHHGRSTGQLYEAAVRGVRQD